MSNHGVGALENAKILLVDLGQTPHLCMRLRRALEFSHDLKLEIRSVSLQIQEMTQSPISVCADAINRFRPDIIFFILGYFCVIGMVNPNIKLVDLLCIELSLL